MSHLYHESSLNMSHLYHESSLNMSHLYYESSLNMSHPCYESSENLPLTLAAQRLQSYWTNGLLKREAYPTCLPSKKRVQQAGQAAAAAAALILLMRTNDFGAIQGEVQHTQD